jgi:hypothetical protein
MKKAGLLLLWLCVCVILSSGCMSQASEKQTTDSNGQKGKAPPQNQSRGPQGQMPRNAPLERVEACAGKSVNDTCEIKMNDTSQNGLCRSLRGNLICFPSGNPQAFLPERVEACAGKAVSDICEYKADGAGITGNCRNLRGNLTCVQQRFGQGQSPPRANQQGVAGNQEPPLEQPPE